VKFPQYLDDTDNEEEMTEDEAGGDDEHVGARPRRMSELNVKEKHKPIPPASSLFVFSSTNKLV
jgi:hypothetical protein